MNDVAQVRRKERKTEEKGKNTKYREKEAQIGGKMELEGRTSREKESNSNI